MNILIVQTGEPLHTDSGNPRPMRAMNLANVMIESGHNVCMVSSAFFHQEKKHRSKELQQIKVNERLEVNLIPSPGYSRNIGFGRLYDHAVLGIRMNRYLKELSFKPDVVFAGFPPIEVAYVAVKYAKSQGIPSLIDVKDQWPSMFVDALPSLLKPVGRVILWPYFYLARKAMYTASGITAMAPGFLNWALDFSEKKRSVNDGVFPLTSPSGQVNEKDLSQARIWWDTQGIKEDSTMNICFIGNFMSVFDFEPIKAAAISAEKEGKAYRFLLCGDGDYLGDVKSMMVGLSNVIFPGWIDRPKIEVLAERCQASMAPYLNIDNFIVNTPNKIVDAMSLGLPILCPLQGEVANLISKHGVGMRYGTDTDKSLYDCVQILEQDHTIQHEMSKNSKKLYKEQFSFEKVYSSLVTHLEKLAAKEEQSLSEKD